MSLEKLFTGSATAKILDVLWEYQDIDITLTDIADAAGRKCPRFEKKWLLLDKL